MYDLWGLYLRDPVFPSFCDWNILWSMELAGARQAHSLRTALPSSAPASDASETGYIVVKVRNNVAIFTFCLLHVTVGNTALATKEKEPFWTGRRNVPHSPGRDALWKSKCGPKTLNTWSTEQDSFLKHGSNVPCGWESRHQYISARSDPDVSVLFEQPDHQA